MTTATIQDQLTLLTGSCELYDGGRYIHGLDIAVRLDVILDWLSSASGGDFVKRRKVLFRSYATARSPASDKLGYHGLACATVSMRAGSNEAQAGFIPLFANEGSPLSRDYRPYPYKKLKLGAWKSEAVLRAANGTGRSINREQLLKEMRNKVGGAHPSSNPSDIYTEVASEMGLGLYAVIGNPSESKRIPYKPTAPFASVRQIAYEIATSFAPHLSTEL